MMGLFRKLFYIFRKKDIATSVRNNPRYKNYDFIPMITGTHSNFNIYSGSDGYYDWVYVENNNTEGLEILIYKKNW